MLLYRSIWDSNLYFYRFLSISAIVIFNPLSNSTLIFLLKRILHSELFLTKIELYLIVNLSYLQCPDNKCYETESRNRNKIIFFS